MSLQNRELVANISSMNESTIDTPSKKKTPLWVFDLLLIFVLLFGAYLRGAGLYWGEYQYLHPDERFLVWVGADISPVTVKEVDGEVEKTWMSWSEYFDTVNSSLNPNNRGHGFYVYGTLPMFLTRVAVELIFGHSGFDVMTQAGRALSAASDLLTVLLVYLIAARLYDRRVGLLAAAFSSVAVLQIQQSHFFTMDTFANVFSYTAIYFAIRIMTDPRPWPELTDQPIQQTEPQGIKSRTWVKVLGRLVRHPLLWPSLAFGIFYGMAMASKLSIYPLAFLLPAAIALRMLKLPRQDASRHIAPAIIYLVVAGLASLVIFRLAQPYAFSGPGILGIKPSERWVAQIREQRAQATDEVDFPPAMQWARRSVTFSFQNLTAWGLGLPLGILAWIGFLWIGWRMVKGDWQKHVLLWGWTAIYFGWQSLALNPTMRYQLPVYPALAIFAAWAIVALWDLGKPKVDQVLKKQRLNGFRLAAVITGGLVLLAAGIYAFGFSRIYTRPITRINASRWIFENIPGPINFHIQTADGQVQQPVPFPYGNVIMPGLAYNGLFTPKTSGTLTEIYLPHLKDMRGVDQATELEINIQSPDGTTLSTASLNENLAENANPLGNAFTLPLDPPIQVDPGNTYLFQVKLNGEPPKALLHNLVSLRFNSADGQVLDYPIFAANDASWLRVAAGSVFEAPADGYVTEIYLPILENQSFSDLPVELALSLQIEGTDNNVTTKTMIGQPKVDDPRGPGYVFSLDTPFDLLAGEKANLYLTLPSNQPAISLTGAGLANEGEWDDGLPLRMDGYDGFGGIYPLDLNFNMYWDDTPEKLERFLRILDESDYIVISSNRQWGSLTRIPERFPMTTTYYRNLLGCPANQDIVWCYRTAQPGDFAGDLGFELVKVFESNPSIGPISINDQFAEEAFTVYDHPKVFVFKKTADYSPEQAREILGSVDLSKVVRLAPLKFKDTPADLLLPLRRWLEQQAGGTWSELFNSESLLNRYQIVGVIVWYLTLALLGLITYPLLRMALPGLADKGYPMARLAGMLLLSYLVWLGGSYNIPFTRPTISLVLLLIAFVGCVSAFTQREELREEFRQRKGYFLLVEAVFLAFFVLDLLIRFGNPDLWHPAKGGEKPMDFSYFNAVLKSTSFPPYDPWFAGGYLNYYYYGFVLVGTLVKWLGITPSFAYNLILPTMFAMIAIGAFSISWNLYQGVRNKIDTNAWWVGLAGAGGMALLGNLGTVKMIYEGYQRLAAPGGIIDEANIFTRLGWAARGFVTNLSGTPLPYGIGDWYWNPSRAIPSPGEVEPITEFPFFTVLYADPHAHLYALPIALLAIGFALSVVISRGRWKNIGGTVAGFFIGGLAVGVLRPTNTWDYYTYLALCCVALAYAYIRYYRSPDKPVPYFDRLPLIAQRLIIAIAAIGLLIFLSNLLFYPFTQWYGQAYNKVAIWQGLRTPLYAYFLHWGLFLFCIVSWMIHETIDWMAKTPVSALKKLEPHLVWIVSLVAVLIGVTILLVLKLPGESSLPFGQGVAVAWVAIPMAAWAGVLLLRPDQPDNKRFVLFMVGTGFVLTLLVEIIVLVGDIGRMNTVFKLYLQVWTLFAVSAAASVGWIIQSIPAWSSGWRKAWTVTGILLLAGALLYPMAATRAKIEDRMNPDAPHTLDGMKYLASAQYDWKGPMNLSEDYEAIRWLQENVQGSPVIVEANLRDLYRWGSRMSIYTGLPGVVGWEWHQQQQRALLPGSFVSERISEIDRFYSTPASEEDLAFLRKYGVQYIILGQLERNQYPGLQLDKFENLDGIWWKEVFRTGNTVIYQVLQN